MTTVERVAGIDGGPEALQHDGGAPAGRRERTRLPLTTDREAWPQGWYFVAFGEDVKRGTVRKERMFGADWAVFRTRSGKVGVVDAVCRHLGADLAEAGRVRGEHLQCGFHGWEYDCDGVCRSAPGVDRTPPSARQLPLHTIEHLGNIWVWYGDGEPHPFPSMGEADDPARYVNRKGQSHESTGDCRTVLEHSSDCYHFKFKHFIGVTHAWEARVDDGLDYAFDWRLGEGEQPHPVWRFIRTRGHVRYAGPCTAVYRVLRPDATDEREPTMAFVLTVTPIEEGRTRFSWRILARKVDRRWRFAPINRAIARLTWAYLWFNIRQDLKVLSSMHRVDQPAWVKADGQSIRSYRAYYDRNVIGTPERWPAPADVRSVAPAGR